MCSNLLSIKKNWVICLIISWQQYFIHFVLGVGGTRWLALHLFTPIHQLYVLSPSKLTFEIQNPRSLPIRSRLTSAFLLYPAAFPPSRWPGEGGNASSQGQLDGSFPSNFVFAPPRIYTCFPRAANHPMMCSMSRTSPHVQLITGEVSTQEAFNVQA